MRCVLSGCCFLMSTVSMIMQCVFPVAAYWCLQCFNDLCAVCFQLLLHDSWLVWLLLLTSWPSVVLLLLLPLDVCFAGCVLSHQLVHDDCGCSWCCFLMLADSWCLQFSTSLQCVFLLLPFDVFSDVQWFCGVCFSGCCFLMSADVHWLCGVCSGCCILVSADVQWFCGVYLSCVVAFWCL